MLADFVCNKRNIKNIGLTTFFIFLVYYVSSKGSSVELWPIQGPGLGQLFSAPRAVATLSRSDLIR
jgi:hypothetical protein